VNTITQKRDFVFLGLSGLIFNSVSMFITQYAIFNHLTQELNPYRLPYPYTLIAVAIYYIVAYFITIQTSGMWQKIVIGFVIVFTIVLAIDAGVDLYHLIQFEHTQICDQPFVSCR
jgi:hypothetical protein